MRRFAERVREIPRWGWGFGLLCLALEYGLYRLGAWLSVVLGTAARAIPCKIPVIDDRISLVPVFVVIYLFSYVFWVCGPAAVSLIGRRNLINYLAGLILAYGIGFLFFILLPTCMDRTAEGLLDQAARPGPFNWVLGIVYAADGGERAFNLFPSYHCLAGAYCYLGVRKRQEISRGYRIYSLVMAVLIALSALLTKQHYFIDVLGGVGIALLCHGLIQWLDPGKRAEEKDTDHRHG
jgi:membrane-associated phospholipid phosphatase